MYLKDQSSPRRLQMARVASFTGLMCLFSNYFLMPILLMSIHANYLMILSRVGLFSLLGTFLGSLLCPFFFPRHPGAAKPSGRGALPVSIAFIVLLVLPNIVLRSLGVEMYIHSNPVRIIVMLFSGFLSPLCYGLFYLTHLLPEKRLSRNALFLFCLAICGAYIVRYITLPLLEHSGLTADPQRFTSAMYTILGWLMAGMGVSIMFCTAVLSGFTIPAKNTTDNAQAAPKTNWSLILRLIGISAIFRIINALMDGRITPILHRMPQAIYEPNLLFAILALVAVGFFSRYFSIHRMIKLFLPFAVSLFILLPCLYFLGDYPVFSLLGDIALRLFSDLVWVIFSAALVVSYYPDPSRTDWQKGFWFYGIATVIFFTAIFQFVITSLNRYIPPASTEFAIALTSISAILLFALSFRILIDKNPSEKQNIAETALPLLGGEPPRGGASLPMEELFRRHGLSKREIEVARLMIEEGLSSESIAERIFIANVTVKNHITSIYRKFNVRGRAQFMTFFVKG